MKAEEERLKAEAEDQEAAQDQRFAGFRRGIEVYCKDDPEIKLFHDIFKCSLPRLFKTLMAVRNMSDDDIIELLTLMTPTKSSQRKLKDYIDLTSSRQNCRAFFVFALLNTLCRENAIRFVFIGRTFLQLLACFSEVSVKEMQDLHIPKKVSDIDVYAVLSSIPPLECRELLVYVFTSSMDAVSHVHYVRDNSSWGAFKRGPVGHLYVAPSRFGNVMKVSKLVSPDVTAEVSDIGFDSVVSFARRFPGLKGTKIVQELPLLGLNYVLTQGALSTSQVVELQFAFPGADSGVLECLRNVLNILRDFVTSNLQDRYFIMTSNLLKFVVRAIQYKHIRVIQLNERGRLNRESTPTIYASLIAELDLVIKSDELFRDISDTTVRKRIRDAGKELIKLFFTESAASLADDMFVLAEQYKQTAIQESHKRLSGMILPMHERMLALYKKHGFDESKIRPEYREVLPTQPSSMGFRKDAQEFMGRQRVPLAVFDQAVVDDQASSQQEQESAPALAPDGKKGGTAAHKNNNKKYTRKNKNQKRMKTVRRKNNKKSDTSKRNKKSLRVYRTKSLHRRRKAIS
jgi:hypothetical protein